MPMHVPARHNNRAALLQGDRQGAEAGSRGREQRQGAEAEGQRRGGAEVWRKQRRGDKGRQKQRGEGDRGKGAEAEKKSKRWIQHHTVPGWSPTPVLSGLKPR